MSGERISETFERRGAGGEECDGDSDGAPQGRDTRHIATHERSRVLVREKCHSVTFNATHGAGAKDRCDAQHSVY